MPSLFIDPSTGDPVDSYVVHDPLSGNFVAYTLDVDVGRGMRLVLRVLDQVPSSHKYRR